MRCFAKRRERKLQEQIELENLKKQVVELHQLYPEGFDLCVRNGSPAKTCV